MRRLCPYLSKLSAQPFLFSGLARLDRKCAQLGISERQAGELAIRQWIQHDRNQVSLETRTEPRSSVTPINRALMNVQLTVVKAELREILGILQVIKPEHELEILRKLQKLMPTAQALLEETRDKKLGEVLTAVAAKVTP